MKLRYDRQAGFTLIEMLVAISLLGLLGVISWRGLDQVVALRDRVNGDTVEIERIVRTIAQIERDIDMSVADALIDPPTASTGLPYAMHISIDQNNRHRVSVFRSAVSGSGGRTVIYWVQDEQLIRTISPERTTDNSDLTVDDSSVVMLGDVRGFSTRVLMPNGWVTVDVFDPEVNERARAIEIAIERGEGERYTSVLPL